MNSLDKYRNSKKEIWVNIGSSTYLLEDFVNLDNYIFLFSFFLRFFPLVKWMLPQKYWEVIEHYRETQKTAMLIKRDCRKPLFFPDESIDHILCSHFLEHIYPDEGKLIIRDFYRVLKSDATLHVIVPDFKSQAEEYLMKMNNGVHGAADEFINKSILSRETRGSFKYRLLEFIGGYGLQHRWMYDYSSIAIRLKKAGFIILDKNETPSKSYRLNDNESVHIIACKR